MLDDQLLEAFMSGFYGYGDYDAPYWFIGMEEGGGNDEQEIANRIGAWDKRGRANLEDVAEYHRDIGIHQFFDKRPKLQPTWNKIIRVVLQANGQETNTEQVRTYQQKSLGRRGGETCLLELLPMPSRKKSEWIYGGLSRLSYLKCRTTYQDHVRPLRIEQIRAKLSAHSPRAVVFYGKGDEDHWKVVAGLEFQEDKSFQVECGTKNETVYISAKHPNTWGIRNAEFERIGQFIRARGAGR